MAITRKNGAWMLFLASLLLLSLAATPYSKAADLTLIGLRLSIIAVLSLLTVRSKWRHRKQASGAGADPADSLLRRCRRWYYGDDTH